MSPSVSIIIPTYNRERLLRRSINSIVKQTFTDWELVIADDGSTDNTKSMVESYEDDRIHYRYQNNNGAASARNMGVAVAKAGIITFLDSDDEADPAWLSKMVGVLKSKEQTGIVCCGIQMLNTSGMKMRQEFPKALGTVRGGQVGRFTTGGVYMLLKTIFQKSGGFDEKLLSGQHTELSYRLVPACISAGYKIENVHEPLIRQYLHDEKRITTNPRSKMMGSLRTFKKHEKLFEKDINRKVNYLSVAGINAIKLGKVKTARKILKRALKLKPFSSRLLIRYAFTFLGPLRRYVWSDKRIHKNLVRKFLRL